MPTTLLIKGGRVVDAAGNMDAVCDLLIEKGKISRVEKSISGKYETLDAKGRIVVPGLIDMHAHLREPGREDEETILSGMRAGAKGGFTGICAMPNTNPVVDNQGAVEFILSLSRKTALLNIFPIGAVTKGQEGRELAHIGELKKAGVVALSDDGNPVLDSQLMRRALEYAKMFNLVVISHCEDRDLSADGVMNEGYISTLLGLRGVPASSESILVARDIELARMTKAKVHIAHVSTKEAVALIRQAKKEGVNITCETAPHYFSLTDDAVRTFDTNAKVNPPLRTKEDCEAVKKALAEGVIDVIATDHAPHSEAEKDVEFDYAPFGMIGLETALALAVTGLIDKKVLTWKAFVEKMSLKPAQILGLDKGTLGAGKDADITIIDTEREWVVDKDKFVSRSQNSPFIGRKLKGVVEYTICAGKVIYKA